VRSVTTLRCDCRNILDTLTHLRDPLNIVKSHRNPFETVLGNILGYFSQFGHRIPMSLSSSLKTFAGKHSAPFRKSEKLTESQLRLVFRKFVYIPIQKVSPARGDFLRISLNYHASQNPNHQRPENVTTIAPEITDCKVSGARSSKQNLQHI
jgi:hypothetical protein